MARLQLPSPKPKANAPAPLTHKLDERAAGYMELEGARKDLECEIVDVKNGISLELGCCNLYDPVKGADEFKCGECTYARQAKS